MMQHFNVKSRPPRKGRDLMRARCASVPVKVTKAEWGEVKGALPLRRQRRWQQHLQKGVKHRGAPDVLSATLCKTYDYEF